MSENETKQIRVETEPKPKSESLIKQEEKTSATPENSVELVKLLNSLTDKTAYANSFVNPQGKTINYNFLFCELPDSLQKRVFFNTPIKIIGEDKIIGIVTSTGTSTVNFRLLTKLDIIITKFE